MKNKTILIILGLIIVLGLAGYFFFQKSRSGSSSEFQLPQLPTLPEEFQPIQPTQQTPETATQPELTEPQIEQIQPQTQNIVIYTDSGFSPNTLRIKLGETVTFKNQSSRAMWPASDHHPTHRLYSGTSLAEHCPDTEGTAFDACTGIQPGNSWSFTFNKKGTWPYHDHLNPSFTGTIIVE